MSHRRSDLYTRDDLYPLDSEFKNLDDLKNFYLNQGGIEIQRGIQNVPSVSSQFKIYQSKKEDVDLIEVLSVCLEENNIPFKWKFQKRGTCVGQSGSLAADITMAVYSMLFFKDFESRAAVSTAYAGSRVEVGGQPGNWDGSNGSWIAEFLTRWGVATLKGIGLGEEEFDEDERLAVRWAATRDGVPEKFERISKDKPIIKAPRVESIEEAQACVGSYNPIIICSNLIPLDRDTDDVVPVQRAGGHATVIAGMRFRRDGSIEWKYANSWSKNWGRDGCVWISSRDLQLILNQGDSYSTIGVHGLSPEKPLA